MSTPANSPAPGASTGVARRWTYAVLALAFLFVLMPFLFWQSTWFGQPLTEEEIEKNLADLEHPRKTQHALAQIADRIVRGDPAVKRWYPQVVRLAGHKVDEIRITAAWVMGQDNSFAEFHETLARMLHDAHPMVRHNAALSLVRFADPAGLGEIRAMLQPYAVRSPGAGTLAQRLKVGDIVNPGTLLGRVQGAVGASRNFGTAPQEEHEIRSQVPGRLERWLASDGAAVSAETEIALLAPSPEMVWEALRALYLVGQPEDLPAVERYALSQRGISEMPPSVAQQAALTARAIRARSRH